jgi:hypothetical protein
MEGRQERVEPLDRAYDLSSLSSEVEAVARGDRSMQQCPPGSRLEVCWEPSSGAVPTSSGQARPGAPRRTPSRRRPGRLGRQRATGQPPHLVASPDQEGRSRRSWTCGSSTSAAATLARCVEDADAIVSGPEPGLRETGAEPESRPESWVIAPAGQKHRRDSSHQDDAAQGLPEFRTAHQPQPNAGHCAADRVTGQRWTAWRPCSGRRSPWGPAADRRRQRCPPGARRCRCLGSAAQRRSGPAARPGPPA